MEPEGLSVQLDAENRLELALSELRVSEIQLHALCEPFFSKYLSKYESNANKFSSLNRIYSLANDIMIIANDARIGVSKLASIMLEGQE